MTDVRQTLARPAPVPARRSQLMRQRVRSAWMFLIPMIVVLAAVAGWPLLRTIYFGFTNTSLSDFENQQWVGFDNYLSVLTLPSGKEIYDGLLADPVWWAAVWNTIRFTVISVLFETVFGLVVALVLNANFKGRGLVRAAILIPWAIPTIVSAKMWAWMLNDQFGIINDILLRLHLISEKIAWTADPNTAMVAVLMVDSFDLWWMTLIYLVAMVALGMHLHHGTFSAIQTLGFTNTAKSRARARGAGRVGAVVVAGGLALVPLFVLFGVITK